MVNNMYWEFFYNELEPDYNSYIKLLKKLENKSKKFYELDSFFYEPYNYQKLIN